jgi:hypothetical protein
MKSFKEYLEEVENRLFSVDDPVNRDKIISWKSDVKQAYQNPRQAREMERKARGRAEMLNRQNNNMVRMYKTIGIDDFKDRILAIKSGGQTSVSVGYKAKGVWNTELVLSGLGRIDYYYAKDVSTNTVDNSGERVPLTPLNKFRSHYDEALAVGKNVIWDKIYYDPNVVQNIPQFFQIVKRNGLEPISINSSGLPEPIAYTKELEKFKKLKLDTIKS